MDKTICVFIVGNGFSQGFGFPSLKKLWDICLQVSSKAFDIKGHFEQSLDKYPLSYFRKNNIKDIELLLSVWSAYIANYENTIPDFNNHVSGRGYYEDYLENLCGHLLEYGDGVPKYANYSNFKNWLKKEMDNFDFRFITLNYDLVLEKIVSEIGKKAAYFGDNEAEDVVFIRKLHGSVNWLRADTPNLQRQDGWKPPIIWSNQKENEYIYNFDADYSSVPFIAFSAPPVIIPPIVNKEYTGIFNEILQFALADLKKAKFVFVVGYSLPESDLLIRKFLQDYSRHSLSTGSRFVYINSTPEHCKEALKVLTGRVEFRDREWSVEIFNEILDSSRL